MKTKIEKLDEYITTFGRKVNNFKTKIMNITRKATQALSTSKNTTVKTTNDASGTAASGTAASGTASSGKNDSGKNASGKNASGTTTSLPTTSATTTSATATAATATAATATAASASTSTTAASDKAKEELTNDIVLKGELDNIKKIVSAMEVNNTLNSAKTATNDYKKGLFDKNKKYSYLDIAAIRLQNKNQSSDAFNKSLEIYAYLKGKEFQHTNDYTLKQFMIFMIQKFEDFGTVNNSYSFKIIFNKNVLNYKQDTNDNLILQNPPYVEEGNIDDYKKELENITFEKLKLLGFTSDMINELTKSASALASGQPSGQPSASAQSSATSVPAPNDFSYRFGKKW